MNLFFETGNQAACFLIAVPFGFTISLCLCLGKGEGAGRIVSDLLLLLFFGVASVWMILFLRDTSFRLYHLLGIISGAFLYFHGMGRIQKHFRRIAAKKVIENQTQKKDSND